MSSDELEAELVRRARAGEAIAAPMLVSYLGDRLLGFAHSHAPWLSDADREQIVEMAVEAGVRSIDRFDPDRGSLFSWFRQQVRYNTSQWRRTHVDTAAWPTNVPVPQLDPAPSWMDDPVVRAGLAAALRTLSRDDRVVLALRNAEELAFAEIGLRLGIHEPTARQRHKRALARLRSAVRQNPDLVSRVPGNWGGAP
jgi:RNA polymerase sigma factor (sigma-70 family)